MAFFRLPRKTTWFKMIALTFVLLVILGVLEQIIYQFIFEKHSFGIYKYSQTIERLEQEDIPRNTISKQLNLRTIGENVKARTRQLEKYSTLFKKNAIRAKDDANALTLNLFRDGMEIEMDLPDESPYIGQRFFHDYTPSLTLPAPFQSLISEALLGRPPKSGNLSKTAVPSKLNKTFLEDVFRSGLGLETYISEKGERGWKENGVIYRPTRQANHNGQGTYHSDYEAYVPFNKEQFFEKTKDDLFINQERKIILWYTKARYVPIMPNIQPMRMCPNLPCGITTNRKYVNSSAAMVFSGQLIQGLPPNRSSPNQIYIFHNQEPPLTKFFWQPRFLSRPWENVFNWTMSYRMDSDVVSHYGIIRKRPTLVQKNYTSILSKKKGLVAWMVSHCDSPGGRQDYAKELHKYIPVDVYGACGPFKCERTMDNKCSEFISTNYKFYLSFENAICTDYITEKFFKYLSSDMILIARASNQFFQHAPSEIFLNTADFASPKHLAQAILRLDKDDDMYIKMLQEKDKYMQIYEDYTIRDQNGTIRFVHYHHEAVPFCEICQKLWNLEQSAKVIPNIGEWFNRKRCRKPTDIGF